MATTDLSTFNNKWYAHGGIVRRLVWWGVSRLFFNTYLLWPIKVKCFILRLFGAKVGKGVVIKPKLNIKYPWHLNIADHVWIGEQVWIDNFTTVTIKRNACISQGAMLLTGNHNYKKSTFDLVIGKITVEEGAWIGAKCVVCPGVVCGSHSVLAVGSVATKNLDEYGIYQGNPATLTRNRSID
jgi:putative colanic acid biosynthesis acetyltransferase WcaF